MKYRRLLHRLAKLIPDSRPVTIRVRWIDSSSPKKQPDSSTQKKWTDSWLKPPADSDPRAPNQRHKPKEPAT